MKTGLTILLITFLLFLSCPARATYPVDIYFFYSQTCPICHEAGTFLGGLAKKYPEINIKSFEMANLESQQAYSAFGQAYHADLSQTPIPFILIDEKAFTAYTATIGSEIEQTAIKCLSRGCISPIEKMESPNEENNGSGMNKTVIWLLILAVMTSVFFLLRKPKK